MRNRKLCSSRLDTPDDDDDDTERKPSHERQKSLSSVPDYHPSAIYINNEMNFGSCSSILHEDFSNSPIPSTTEKRNSTSSGFEALRMSFSKRRAQQGTLKAATQLKLCTADVDERSDMFLLQDSVGDSSPTEFVDSLEAARDSEDVIVPGWPLLNNTIGFEKPLKKTMPAAGKVVDLPVVVLQEHDSSPSPIQEFGSREETETKSRLREVGMSLAQEVDCLCSNRACVAFAYEDLEAATSRFSQGERNRLPNST